MPRRPASRWRQRSVTFRFRPSVTANARDAHGQPGARLRLLNARSGKRRKGRFPKIAKERHAPACNASEAAMDGLNREFQAINGEDAERPLTSRRSDGHGDFCADCRRYSRSSRPARRLPMGDIHATWRRDPIGEVFVALSLPGADFDQALDDCRRSVTARGFTPGVPHPPARAVPDNDTLATLSPTASPRK